MTLRVLRNDRTLGERRSDRWVLASETQRPRGQGQSIGRSVFSALTVLGCVTLSYGQEPQSLDDEIYFVPTPRAVQEERLGTLLIEVSDYIDVDRAREDNNLDGQGTAVAVVDTGVLTDHRDLMGRIVTGFNASGDGRSDGATSDARGHGTHVAGIIAASSPWHTGMAPAARIVPIKVFSDRPNSGASPAAIKRGLQWVADNAARLGITVVNLSLGSGNYDGVTETTYDELIENLCSQRIVVVCAAGNSYATYRRQGMGSPAISVKVVSVLAVYDADVGEKRYGTPPFTPVAIAYETGPGYITPFTQRLHPSFGDHPGTTIGAPGAVVTASGIFPPRYSSEMEGTSMAAPVVAGVVALMQQGYKRIHNELPTVEQVITALRDSALLEEDGDNENDNVPNVGKPFPILNAREAVAAILSAS